MGQKKPCRSHKNKHAPSAELGKYPPRGQTVRRGSSVDTRELRFCTRGNAGNFQRAKEISLNIRTFWACAVPEVDGCTLEKPRSGMCADSFMA